MVTGYPFSTHGCACLHAFSPLFCVQSPLFHLQIQLQHSSSSFSATSQFLATQTSTAMAAVLRSPSSAFLTRRPAHFSARKTPPTLTRSRSSSCRCSLSVNFEELGYDLYDLLGIDSAAGQKQIRASYRWLQKRCHPDIAGSDGHHMAILLNEAYAVLSDPDTRHAYDQTRAERVKAEGYTGQPIYSTWHGPPGEERAVFVDEVKCIGCLKCALVAPRTFAIETVYGRARAVGQWADTEETVRDAIRVCPVDCISWVEKAKLPALEFLMSKQPRVAVRMNTNNNVGARVTNVFVDAERFLEKLAKKKKASKFQESPAQREARMAAAEQIRTSAGWWWHHLVGNQSREFVNYQRAARGAIVPLNWGPRQQSTRDTDSDKTSNSNGRYEYQRIGVTKELSEAAARLREGRSPFISKRRPAVSDGEYWVPASPEKRSGVPSPVDNLEANKRFSASVRRRYNASPEDMVEKVSVKPREIKMKEDWKQRIVSGIPLATSAAAGLVVGFGSGSGEAGGLETHLAGPLALMVINSSEMQIFLAASFWYIVGTFLASVITALLYARNKP